jgi:hypothetical protein
MCLLWFKLHTFLFQLINNFATIHSIISVMQKIMILVLMALLTVTCTTKQNETADSKRAGIDTASQDRVISTLKEKCGETDAMRLERGVRQAAQLWRESDGSAADFEKFCTENFITGEADLDKLFNKLERNFEIFNGYFHRMDILLKEPIELVGADPEPVDMMFGSYNVSAHLTDDFFNNKIAFITVLNFPFYTLEEKTKMGSDWNRKHWAFARMGDLFTSRVPADIILNLSKTLTAADAYITDYNMYMGTLVNGEGKALFPAGMKLISHWGIRDELKSNYAAENGLEKQRMIYQVMKRIIDQTIPQQVINKNDFTWDPYKNKIFRDGTEAVAIPESDRRYEVLLGNFHALKALDAYNPGYPTFIIRAFEQRMEIPQADIEKLFTGLVSSSRVKEVAAFIRERLGRPLEPFDIWYNGFKAAGNIPEEKLTALTSKKYPDKEAVRKDLPAILTKLGWAPLQANRIGSLITVDAARGSGHASGADMRNDLAHLRTRIVEGGMDYKGYNIAVHEFGHCVEQTITMNDVDYYMLNGVPNTAFTEAIAFLFQKRDLELLGIAQQDPLKEHLLALDNFWACYEIMGVSLVDMQVWKWMYDHPDATPSQLKETVISIAKVVWNKYYAEVLGGNDEPILAIYSHMIDNPLYLSNYPVGHLIDFQLEQFVNDKKMSDEVTRMLVQGRIIPQLWMKGAVGKEISIEPTIEAAGKALEAIDN